MSATDKLLEFAKMLGAAYPTTGIAACC
jgi:hypothetical protein